jgi:ABC-type molybdate transport system permease subunit
VAGIALTTLYSPDGWLGRFLEPMGIKVAYAPLGIVVALTFVGLPFVVRTVQPVLENVEGSMEEAAASLGAGRLATIRRVVLPEIRPALLTGMTLAFARGLGEYGSIVFISGNMPMKTEITPLLIMIQLEQFDYAGATALALVFLIASFVLLFVINSLIAKGSAADLAIVKKQHGPLDDPLWVRATAPRHRGHVPLGVPRHSARARVHGRVSRRPGRVLVRNSRSGGALRGAAHHLDRTRRRPLECALRHRRGVGHRQVRVSRAAAFDHDDRSAV